tara:strand:- start:2766 stop:3068 length:303 start_codon:yes stop_codon:yes gene_type:complete
MVVKENRMTEDKKKAGRPRKVELKVAGEVVKQENRPQGVVFTENDLTVLRNTRNLLTTLHLRYLNKEEIKYQDMIAIAKIDDLFGDLMNKIILIDQKSQK